MKSTHLILTIYFIWPGHTFGQINNNTKGIMKDNAIISIKFKWNVVGVGDCFEWGVEYHGGGLENPMVTGVTSPDSCQILCQESHSTLL